MKKLNESAKYLRMELGPGEEVTRKFGRAMFDSEIFCKSKLNRKKITKSILTGFC